MPPIHPCNCNTNKQTNKQLLPYPAQRTTYPIPSERFRTVYYRRRILLVGFVHTCRTLIGFILSYLTYSEGWWWSDFMILGRHMKESYRLSFPAGGPVTYFLPPSPHLKSLPFPFTPSVKTESFTASQSGVKRATTNDKSTYNKGA